MANPIPEAPPKPPSKPKDDNSTLKPPPDINRDDLLGDGDSGGGGGGGSKPVGPSDYARSQYLSQLASTYISLWGVQPPPGYLEGIAGQGMNLFEFEAHERAKPSFRYSPRYAEERLSIGLGLAERFGSLG